MSKNDLLRYWPREDDVRACVKTDAEASSEAVSLAVHQPMRFERRVIGALAGATSEACDEYDLLRAFLSENLSEGRVIVPIVGSSGVGKSHVVRWLDAQIQRMPGHERRVVIRIPKGTSLKGVLGILLSKLHGAAYATYRAELLRAQEELNPKEAAGMLCEMLAHTLGEIEVEARARLLANPADKTAQERQAYCRADMLPALLRNQLLRDQHFVRSPDGGDGVVKRLVEQLTEGRDAGSEDDRQSLFGPNDLLFDRIEREALGRAEARALTQFEREERRLAGARILNAALDDAKQRLLRLDPTVSDLFDAVRQELLKEGKELVLLVEDFAVLSGLQKQLLQVIIKEAIRDGRQVLCTMRTALAYTSGYLDAAATVLTRANVEYRISDEPGTEEEILDRISRLIGAYLNAARLGQSELEREYRDSRTATDDLRGWIPRFIAKVEPEALATLEAFGASQDRYEFFPFNRAAIHELAREGCSQAGRLVYNPRYIIQNVIYKVLNHRDLFEQGQFPPSVFGARGIPSRVVEEVRLRVPSSELDRYLRFLAYWGGLPTTPTEIGEASERVFEAFGLDRALFGPRASAPSSLAAKPKLQPAKMADKPSTPVQPPLAAINPVEAKWEQVLEQWRRGIAILQSDARELRKWIVEAFKESIEWDWHLYRPRKDEWSDHWFSSVFVPSAGGNAGMSVSDAMVAVCSDEDLADETKSARVQSTLMAFVRFHGVHKGSWDYEGAEADLRLYSAFLDDNMPRVRAYVQERYFRAQWDPVPTLVNGLLIGARALGVEGADKDGDHAALLDALFAPIASPSVALAVDGRQPTETDATGWIEFTATLSKCRRPGEKESREQLSWAGHLLNLVGARQGGADTVYAVDLIRLRPAIEQTLANWSFAASLPNPSGVPEFGPLRTTHGELKRQSSAIGKARERLSTWRSKMVAWLGQSWAKEELLRELKDAVDSAKAAGLTHTVDAKRLVQSIEAFRGAKVVAALEDAARLEQNASPGTILTVLGRDYEPTARVCEELNALYEEFVTAVDGDLRSEATLFGENPISEARAELRSELTAVQSLLKGMSR